MLGGGERQKVQGRETPSTTSLFSPRQKNEENNPVDVDRALHTYYTFRLVAGRLETELLLKIERDAE